MCPCPRCGLSSVTLPDNLSLRSKDLFDSFHVPLAAERSSYLDILEKGREEVRRLDIAINTLKQERQKILETVVTPYTSAVSCLRKLPAEILEEVFEACLWVDEPFGATWHDTSNAVLMLVCRRWGQIIQGSQRLWSYIRLDSSETSFEQFQRLMETKMKLCYSWPLDVQASLSYDHFIEYDYDAQVMELAKADFAGITSLLRQTQKRWKDVKVSISPDFLEPLFPSQNPPNFPILERFEISFHDNEDYWPSLNLNATQAPLLIDVTFTHSELTPMTFPWSQLIRLHLIEFPWGDFPPILAQLPRVQTLIASFERDIRSRKSPRDVAKVYECPALRELFTPETNLASRPIQLLKAPSLRTLGLDGCGEEDIPILHTFFSQPCHQHLTSFHLGIDESISSLAIPMLGEALMSLLALQNLALIASNPCLVEGMDILMQELERHDTRQFTLFPALSSLILSGFEMSPSIFLKTMRIRLDKKTTSSRPLRHIALDKMKWRKISPRKKITLQIMVLKLRGYCHNDQVVEDETLWALKRILPQ